MAAYLARLESRVEQLDRRVNNIVREAKVTEVDAETALCKVKAHGLDSFWAPWLERANSETGIRTWSPPQVGERVLLISPSGEPGQGVVLRGGYWKDGKPPHDQLEQDKLQVGNAHILVKDGMIELQVGDAVVRLTAEEVLSQLGSSSTKVTGGNLALTSPRIDHHRG